MSKLSAIKISHEHYKITPFKRLKPFLKVFKIALYLAAVTLIINLAENNNQASASPIGGETGKYNKVNTFKELQSVYMTDITASKELSDIIIRYSNKYQLNPTLLLALIKTESNFNSNAVNYNYNGTIDRGLCQLNSNTFSGYTKEQFFDPEFNVDKAAEFLKWCLSQSENNVIIALAYYNAGIGTVFNESVGETTLNYINKIIENMSIYDEELKFLSDKMGIMG